MKAQSGKIIRDGDGINKAMTYELGTPISTGKDKEPIRELEFHAATYGDIEDVMAADSAVQQTALLIKTVAKPLGSSLLRLPDWALNVITVADGVTISNWCCRVFSGRRANSGKCRRVSLLLGWIRRSAIIDHPTIKFTSGEFP